MEVTIGWRVIPLVASIVMLIKMNKTEERKSDYDFSGVFSLLWLIPILFVWLVYLLQ